MRIKKWDYLSYTICFAAGMVASQMGLHYLSGIILIVESIVLYVLNFRRTENLVDIRGLFSLAWVGGIGLACLKLSLLQQEWENMTWLCFFCAYFCFMVGYDVFCMWKPGVTKYGAEKADIIKDDKKAFSVLCCIIALGAASIVCFVLEAVVVGFIPLFSPEPHAYSYFHVSGVHYFTISCILIPALTVLYCKIAEEWNMSRMLVLIWGNVTAVAIPILCVSRFQLLFAVGFAAVTYLMLYRRITWKMIVGAVLILIPVYVLLTLARRHDVTYLNGIFEMKNSKMPIFITQPYIYVANNFENFNCLVAQLPEFAGGIRMLFPILALTGLKFVFPELVSLPIYTTKEELTTVTMFYDAYYDFGLPGIIVFALILGVLAAVVTGWVEKDKNPASYLFYGQIAIYFGLAFFTTWFSNPTTWFWLVITMLMYLFIGYEKKGVVWIKNRK